MKTSALTSAAALLCMLLLVPACSSQRVTAPARQPISMEALHQSGGVPPGWQFAPPPGDAAAGRRTFVELGCHTCHAVQGAQFPPVPATEQRPGPDLTGMGSHHPAEYFAEAILNPNAVLVDGPGYIGPDGRTVMPAYPDMTLAQLADLVAYVKSLTTGGDAGPHAHHVLPPRAASGTPPPEAAVFLVQVNEITTEQLNAFDEWLGETGAEDLKNFTGFVSLDTYVNRSAERRELVTVFGFENEVGLRDFLSEVQAPDAPPEVRALLRRARGGTFRSSTLYRAPGLSLP